MKAMNDLVTLISFLGNTTLLQTELMLTNKKSGIVMMNWQSC